MKRRRRWKKEVVLLPLVCVVLGCLVGSVPALCICSTTTTTVTRRFQSSRQLIAAASCNSDGDHKHQQDNSTTTTTVSSQNTSSNHESVTTTVQDKTTHRRRFLQSTFITVATTTAAIPTQTTTTAFASTIESPSLPQQSSSSLLVPTPKFDINLNWPLGKVAFSLLPLAGGSRRATVEECIVPDTIWTHDQIQGIVNVNVPVRQTTVRLKDDGDSNDHYLWVHNPVAPTPQHVRRMKELERRYDAPIRHIVLGTVALEHKATFGPFCQQFPYATVWIQPGQWSFPLNLPIDILGVTQRGPRLRELPSPTTPPSSSLYREFTAPPEWQSQIDYEMLGPLQFQAVGAFAESAFYHKDTKTLIVTDTVVSVTKTPPSIIQEDPRAMLFHARDYATQPIQDTPETRERGWRRMVQFGLVFFPSQIDVVPLGQAFRESRHIDPSLRNLGDGAVPLELYPWTWHDNDADLKNFNAISENGRLFCPPILTKLILDREPDRTLAWVDAVCRRFPFERVIPCHLNNNIKAGPQEFRAAFDVLRSRRGQSPGSIRSQRPLPEDLALLQKASDTLTDLGIVGPSQVCDGEPARVVGRFARRSTR